MEDHILKRVSETDQKRDLINSIMVFIPLHGELHHILSLSLSFMLLFAAYYSMLNMQKTVISSIASDQPDFLIEGYTLTGISFTVFAIGVWFGPYINYAIGAKITMVVSAIGYLFYVVSYATETQWVVILSAVVDGVAAGALWPAQGCYMIENSSPETTSRNFGIFWFIYSSSNMFGNVCVYFIFHGQKYLNQNIRRTAIYFLTGIDVLAVITFILLPNSKNDQIKHEYGLIKTLKKSWSILISPKMMIMTLAFCYVGLQQSFGGGIYGPSVGFTLAFGDSAKELMALSGMSMSIGSLLGSLCPIIFADWIRRHVYARRLIVLSGIAAQLLCYLITFINLPDSAVFGNTLDQSLISPSATLAILGSVLLSYGDCCLATQVYSFIGEYYRENSAETCALYKFVKSAMVAVSFFSCSHLGLHKQLAILAVTAVVGGIGFCLADRRGQTCNNIDEQKSDTKEQTKL